MTRCQVTNLEYGEFTRETGISPPPFWQDFNFNHPRQPVVGVSWFEAVQYCEWLKRRSHLECRLPTEAEWERAARGGREGRLYPWGDEPPQSLPDYAHRWRTGPEPVGKYAPKTYMNGAVTGTRPTITTSLRSGIREAPKVVSVALPVEGHGGTTSK